MKKRIYLLGLVGFQLAFNSFGGITGAGATEAELEECSLYHPSDIACHFSPFDILGRITGNNLVAYQQLKGVMKQELLWNRVKSEPYSRDRLSETLPIKAWDKLKGLGTILSSPNFMKETFLLETDEFPADRKREVLFHRDGVVGRIEYIAKENLYSGVLKSGAPGIIRLSEVQPQESPTDAVNPGAAFKLLIDGRPSENILAIYDLAGQGSNTNFFANPLTTNPSAPVLFAHRLGGIGFDRALEALDPSVRPLASNLLPQDRLARWTADGVPVTENAVVAPHALIFEPSDEAKALIASDSTQNFRLNLIDAAQLIGRKKPLYHVMAKLRPDSQPEHIGDIYLTSELVGSSYGDEVLFFQHQSRKSH